MEEKELKYKFLDLLYKHTYVLPANSIKKLILKYDKAQTLIKKQKLYNMLLEFEKLGVATMKDLKDIKKLMTRKLSEPVYEKEIKIKKNIDEEYADLYEKRKIKKAEKKYVEKEEEISILDNPILHSINIALKELKKIKSGGIDDKSIFMEYNIPYIIKGDEDLKKTVKKEERSGDYGNYFILNNDNEINEAISTLNILKKNNKLLRTFKYKINDNKNKKSILGLGIKKNKKNNNSYLSLLKSMI